MFLEFAAAVEKGIQVDGAIGAAHLTENVRPRRCSLSAAPLPCVYQAHHAGPFLVNIFPVRVAKLLERSRYGSEGLVKAGAIFDLTDRRWNHKLAESDRKNPQNLFAQRR